MKGFLAMKKKIAMVTALLLSVSLLAGGCGKSDKEKDGDVSTNVITQSGESITSENGETTAGQTMSSEELSQMWDKFTAETTARTEVVTSTVDYSSRYGYNSLTKDEKELYKAILDAATTCTPRIPVTDRVTTEIWAKIYGMVYNQEPQLFYLRSKVKVGKLYFTEVEPAVISKMQSEIDDTVNKLLAEANSKSSTFEKLKVFHDYIVLNNNFGESDDVGNYNSSIYNAFNSDKSDQLQCAGYAKAMQYLCDRAGIESMVITGANSKGYSHAWNVVKVDGAWYNLDTTWDDPILNPPDTTNIRYNYMLVPDSWIHNKTHFKVNELDLSSSTIKFFTPPSCTETKENYFVKNNKVYSDAASAEKAIKDAMLAASNSKTRTAEIMVSSKDVYDAIHGKSKDLNKWIKENGSNVKGIADSCNEHLLLIEFDVIYS
jgi:hypothetical protein